MDQVLRLILYVFGATAITAVIFVALGRTESVLDTINEEIQMISSVMGRDAAIRVSIQTEDAFGELAAARDFVYDRLPDKDEEFFESEKGTKTFFVWLNGQYRSAVDTFWTMTYQSIQRFYILVELLPMCLIFCLAGFVDGNSVKNIASSSFRYSSPIFYKLGFLMFFGSIMIIASIITLPLKLHFLVFLVSVCSIGFFIRQVMANMPNKM